MKPRPFCYGLLVQYKEPGYGFGVLFWYACSTCGQKFSFNPGCPHPTD